MAERIGVGIVGANPERGWAMRAHIPALSSLPQFELRAVATSRRESAEAAARKFGARHAFVSAAELAAHPDVDVVAICVKVPRHRELVRAALEAGKAVYCEWPLGNGLAEAVELAELARAKQVRTAVGLQARASAAFHYVRDLIAEGYVGTVRSTSVVACASFGDMVDREMAYLADKTTGANLMTIPFGHFTDAMCFCLGEFDSLQGTLATLRGSVRIIETGEMIPATAPDQVAVSGRLAGGAVAALHFRAGRSRGTNMLWEINGSDGDLVITAGSGHVQYMELDIKGGRGTDAALTPLPIPDRYRTAPAATPAGAPLNVAQLYLQLESDLRHGTRLAADFDHAVLRHRMLDAIETSSDEGVRKGYAGGGVR